MNTISRRTILRGAGVSMVLPMLETMGASPRQRSENQPPMRFAAVLLPFGIYSETFHPTTFGGDYEMPEVLKVLEPYRKEMTVLSGVDHGVKGGHQACHTALSGITHTQASAYVDGNIGLDQRLAEHVAGKTRISSMCLGSSGRIGAGWTRSGVAVPPVKTPLDAFNLLFLEQSTEMKKERAKFLASGKSVLDAVNASAKDFSRGLSSVDRAKLDDYFTAVRETERGLSSSIEWLDKPYPKPTMSPPKVNSDNVGAYMQAWFDVAHLAFETDSTRVVALSPMSGISTSLIEGVENEYHGLSHHGRAPERVAQLKLTEKFILSHLARFYDKLMKTRQADGSRLLDSTMVLFTSGMGDGSSHTNSDVPVILAGGGFAHGKHINVAHKQPLNNLYLTMAQQFGVETDRFNTSTGTLTGLDHA